LTKPFEAQPKHQRKQRVGEIECDEALFQRLRKLRRQIADEREVPAYIIFSDTSLREMACARPSSAAEFARIPGVGEQKLRDFGEQFTAVIRGYVARENSVPPENSEPRVGNQLLFG
jgi:ATP-dependent DNA helicase RecQ